MSSHAFLWGPSSQWPLKSAGEEARGKGKGKGDPGDGVDEEEGAEGGMVMRWMRRGRRQRRARQ